MTSLKEPWLQELAWRSNLPAIRPTVVSALLPVVEMQLRKIIQQAYKFTRRGKGGKMTVEDINQALELYHLEPLYGLIDQRHLSTTGGAPNNLGEIVSLVQLARAPLPKCPLLPELSLHWLAVEGVQPLIPENPSQIVAGEAGEQPSSLPRELQQFYMRVTGVLLAAESGDRPLRAVLSALREDSGLQDLVPYLSKFVYHHVKANMRSLPLLRTLMSAVQALLSNPGISVDFHLQQMLPAVFTCIVAARLSASPYEDHWSLRAQAASVVASACIKYAARFPELQARVCKTFLDALSPERALPTLCGGLLGISALGQTVVRSLLLPQVSAIGSRLEVVLRRRPDSSSSSKSSSSSSGASCETASLTSAELAELQRALAHDTLSASMCLSALAFAVGTYLSHCLRLGNAPSIGPLLPGLAAGAGGDQDGTGPPSKARRVVASESNSQAQRVSSRMLTAVAGLEEALVPHYASAAPDGAFCRVFF